jgi:hypothetical protein
MFPTIHTLVYDNSKPDLKSASFKICGALLTFIQKKQSGFKGERHV